MTHAVHSSQTSRGKDRQTSMALGGSALGSMTLLDLLNCTLMYFSFMKFTVIYCNDLQWLQAPKEFPGCRRCRNILRHVDSTHQDSLMSAAGSTEAKACGKCLPTFSIICLLQPLLRIRSSHSMVACHQILILGLNMKAWLCHTCVIKVVTMLLFNAHHLLLMQLPFHRCWRDHSMIFNAFFNVKAWCEACVALIGQTLHAVVLKIICPMAFISEEKLDDVRKLDRVQEAPRGRVYDGDLCMMIEYRPWSYRV